MAKPAPSQHPKPWPRLTETAEIPSPAHELTVCQLCKQPGSVLWYECDDNDRPQTDKVLVTCGRKPCTKVIDQHPRLYEPVGLGLPGHFRRLCGRCAYRSGTSCTHPDLKANGGAGLMVTPQGINGILCTKGRGRGCHPFPREAVRCAGLSPVRLVPS